MNLNPSLDPSFLSDLDTFPVAEVGDHVEAAAREASLEALENLTSALIDRALRALRTGSQQDLLEEALAVSQGLSGDAGDALRAPHRHPEIFGAWTALNDLLAEAGRRHDRAAVPGILKSTGKHGQKILEILARQGEPVPRASILTELKIGESHLSHLLHHLEEADLVLRFRSGKAVHVALGRVGKEVTESSIFPRWVQALCEILKKLQDRVAVGSAEIEADLRRMEAPSELVAKRLADPLSLLSEMLAGQQGKSLPQPGSPRGGKSTVPTKTQRYLNGRQGSRWGQAA